MKIVPDCETENGSGRIQKLKEPTPYSGINRTVGGYNWVFNELNNSNTHYLRASK